MRTINGADALINRRLLTAARRVMQKAYAPYSKFRVGAAVLAQNGQIFSGANVENASYGLTICAERAAICKAVGEGQRRLRRFCVVADTKQFVTPCGACLQVMAEFAPDNALVILGRKKDSKMVIRFYNEFLTMPFRRHRFQ